MEIEIDKQFPTKNTALAAYLYMEGFCLLDVVIDSFPTIFIFENNSEQLLEHVHKFQIAKAEGNLVLFFEAYRKCLRMTKVGKL